MLSSLLAFFIVGFFALLAIGVVFAILGTIFSLALGVAGFLLFKVAPIVLIGWIVLKLVQRFSSTREISAADRKWLDE